MYKRQVLTSIFIVGSQGSFTLSYQLDSKPEVELRSFAAGDSVVWMDIIPSVSVGEHTVQVKFSGQAAGLILSNCQFDLREFT